MKTVSDRIFELLKERKMSQKEFSKKTGDCRKHDQRLEEEENESGIG